MSPHPPAGGLRGPTRCQRVSWSSTINNLGAPVAPRGWEPWLGGGRVRGPRGAPTFGMAEPKAARQLQKLGGPHGSPHCSCALGAPKTPSAESRGWGYTWGSGGCAPHPPCPRAGGCPGGRPGVDFPFPQLQLLVYPPGQEMGTLPVVFSMSGAPAMLSPASKPPQPSTGHQQGEHQSHRRHHGLIAAQSPELPMPAVLDASGTAGTGRGGSSSPRPSLADAEVPEDDVENVLGTHVAGDPAQVPSCQPQLLGCQPQVLPALPAVPHQCRGTVAQVKAVPALGQAG